MARNRRHQLYNSGQLQPKARKRDHDRAVHGDGHGERIISLYERGIAGLSVAEQRFAESRGAVWNSRGK